MKSNSWPPGSCTHVVHINSYTYNDDDDEDNADDDDDNVDDDDDKLSIKDMW